MTSAKRFVIVGIIAYEIHYIVRMNFLQWTDGRVDRHEILDLPSVTWPDFGSVSVVVGTAEKLFIFALM